MTEQEWLECGDVDEMLEYFRYRGHERQERLLGCAACRRVWDLINDIPCRRALEASERYADGEISYGDLDRHSAEAQEAFEEASWGDSEINGVVAYAVSCASSPDLSIDLLSEVLREVSLASRSGLMAEQQVQSSLIRDVFGNPFRPVTMNPAWLVWNDGTVRKIAQSIYEERAFQRLPILADALTDAGCDNADLLNHCRSEGPHVKGCWVVDLLLGKT